MNFGFTDEQELLRQEVRKFLDEQCPLEEVRRIAATPGGYSSEQWKQLGELGWLGLVIPERYGGSDLGWEELVVLLEETGRTLFPAPLISTTLAAAAILASGNDAQKEHWLPRIADGSCIGTLAMIEESDVLGAPMDSVADSPLNSTLPVRHSYNTQPNDQMSVRTSSDLPRACSGLM